MYPITNEVKALFESEQRKVLRITGTDKNGRSISITEDNVIADSFQIDRYSCNGEKLEIGTAIAAQLTLALENGNGQYDSIAFEGAELFAEVGVADWTQSSPTIHWVPCGYFTPDEQLKRMSTISITALDRMMRFDAVPPTLIPWTTANGDVMTTQGGAPIYFLKSVRFPCTIAQLVQQIATLCNVPFTQSLSGFPNYDATIQELPVTVESTSYRLILQWCAAIMACNAWIDWTGSLRFSWYTNATGYTSTIDNRYSSDMYENDLTITGVSYTNISGAEFVQGTNDYAVDIIGNYLIGGQATTMLPAIAAALDGFTYRPFTAAAVNAPYLWPMDIITFTDKDGNDHTSALTNVAFGLNGTTALESKGMTYAVNRGKQPSGMTKQQAQLVNEVRESVDKLDDSLTQQEIFNRLTDNGAEQGLILYDGKLYLNASYIRAGTVSADILKGGTLKLGGENNQNGIMQLFDLLGYLYGTLDNSGLALETSPVGRPTITVKKVTNRGNEIVTIGGNTAPLDILIDWNGALYYKHFTFDSTGMYMENDNNEYARFDIDGLVMESGTGLSFPSIYLKDISRNESISLSTRFGLSIVGSDSSSALIGDGNGRFSGYIRVGDVTTTRQNLGVPATDGTGASGEWDINISGNADNVTGIVDTTNGGTGVNLNDSPSLLVDLGENTADDVFKASPRPGVTGVLDTTNGGTGVNLNDSPSLLVDLESNSADDVFQASPRPGVTGVLDTTNGGTGVNLNDSPSILVDLESNSDDDVFKASPRPGVTGVLDITNGGTGANNVSDARDNLDVYSRDEVDNRILAADTDISIPSPGAVMFITMPGLTENHELIRWNFSDSAENAPPTNLIWYTYNGYFRIHNNGNTTDETIRPVFALPVEQSVTIQ